MSVVRVTYIYDVDMSEVSDEEYDDAVLQVYEEADPGVYTGGTDEMVADVIVAAMVFGVPRMGSHPAVTRTIEYG